MCLYAWKKEDPQYDMFTIISLLIIYNKTILYTTMSY